MQVSSYVQKGFFIIGFSVIASLLEAVPVAIPAIKVTANHKAVQAATGSQATFTRKQIHQQGSISLVDFFNKQGVVQVTSHSNEQNQTAISLRGFGNNAGANVLLLLNEIPLLSFTDIGPNLNSLMVENIKHVDVLLGSYGSLYGNQAVGGVINMTTQIPLKNITHVGFGLGNDAQRLGRFFVSRRKNQWGMSLSGLGYQTNNDQLHNLQNDYDLNTQVSYSAPRDTVTLTALAYKNDIQIPNGQIWEQPRSNETSDNHTDVKSYQANLENHWEINDAWRWHTDISSQQSASKGQVNVPFDSGQENYLWNNRFFYQHWLQMGFDGQTQRYYLKNSVQDNWAHDNVADGYGQATWGLVKHWDLILGAREAYQWMRAQPTGGSAENTTSPVFVNEQGVVWHIHSGWQWYLRRDTNYRFAQANEKVWVASNVEDLKTQTGVSYETGVKWKAHQNYAQLGLYRLDLHNEIAYDPNPTTESPFGQMTNLPSTRRLGVDLLGNYWVTPRFGVNAQASLVNPYFSSGVYKNNEIPAVSPITASTSVLYQDPRQWSINLNETYHSAFYASDDLNNEGPKMPDYFLTNVNVLKTWHEFELGLEVDNVFNKHYVRFADDLGGSPPQIEYYSSAGLMVMATVDWRGVQ